MNRERRIQLHDMLLRWLQNQRRPVTLFQLDDFRLGALPDDVSARQVVRQLEQMIAAGEVSEGWLRCFSVAPAAKEGHP